MKDVGFKVSRGYGVPKGWTVSLYTPQTNMETHIVPFRRTVVLIGL